MSDQRTKTQSKASTAPPKTKKQAGQLTSLYAHHFPSSKIVTLRLTWSTKGHNGASGTRTLLSPDTTPSIKCVAHRKLPSGADLESITFRSFFADSPWLNIPIHRQARISVEPLYPRGGLHGGSSKEAPKPSKLAALAAARKKKASESLTSDPKPSNNPVALLDKLGKSRIKENNSPRVSVEKVAADARQTPSILQLRRQPPRKDIQKSEPEEVPESLEPSLPAEKPQDDYQLARAAPSSFATTMLGPNRAETPASAIKAYYNPFQSSCDMSAANSNPFAGPSPDDIVSNAQSASKGLKSKSQTKGSEGKPTVVENVTNGLNKSTIADSPRPPKNKNLDVVAEYEKSTKKQMVNFVVVGS